MSRSLIFQGLMSHKEDELDHMLQFDTTRKPYMGSLMTLLHMNLNERC